MSDFQLFMKENKIFRKNRYYPATSSLKDENGQPLIWELKAVSTKESEDIQKNCYTKIKDEYNFDYSSYLCKLICNSVVYPNLNDKDLQDSYSCYSPEELIKELINSPGEYKALADEVQDLCGFNEKLEDNIAFVKN